MSLYCDMTIDGNPIFTGIPCLDRVALNARPYLAFVGTLFFYDTQGNTDPMWEGLGDRYVLGYVDPTGTGYSVPLSAVPSQIVNAALYLQNCTLSIYLKETA